jgi:hypothetical protein
MCYPLIDHLHDTDQKHPLLLPLRACRSLSCLALRSLDRFECSKAPRVVGTCRPPVTPPVKITHREHCLPIRVQC